MPYATNSFFDGPASPGPAESYQHQPGKPSERQRQTCRLRNGGGRRIENSIGAEIEIAAVEARAPAPTAHGVKYLDALGVDIVSASDGIIAGRDPEKAEAWPAPGPVPLRTKFIRFELYEKLTKLVTSNGVTESVVLQNKSTLTMAGVIEAVSGEGIRRGGDDDGAGTELQLSSSEKGGHNENPANGTAARKHMISLYRPKRRRTTHVTSISCSLVSCHCECCGFLVC